MVKTVLTKDEWTKGYAPIKQHEAEAVCSLVKNNIITINEARERLGFPLLRPDDITVE